MANHLDGLSVLALEWIDALNLRHRMMDDATAHERETIRRRAQNAADIVENLFFELGRARGTGKRGGPLKAPELMALSERYKAARTAGMKLPPWNVYLMNEKRQMVRTMALEQRARAMRGIRS